MMAPVSEMVLDQKHLSADDRIIRPKHKEACILVREDFGDELEDADFVGPYMLPLEEYAG